MAALPRRFVLRRLLPALAAIAVVAGGVVVVNQATGGEASEPLCAEPAGNFDPAWPQDTLTDWVSYSDQLSIVTVTSEQALGPLEETDLNGGMVGRRVDLAIERTLWRRVGAPSVEDDLSVQTWGWMVDGHDPHRLRVGGGPWLEVGGRYVLPLARVKTDDGFEWVVDSAMAAFPLEGSAIVCGTVRETEFADEDISGSSVDELAARYAATKPDPLAVKYGDLDPAARWLAVAEEQAP